MHSGAVEIGRSREEILLVRGWRRLVATINSFTVAHFITLGMTVLDLVRVPGPPVEAFIALSNRLSRPLHRLAS